MAKILCFGDSNTWGTAPASIPRFDSNQRWPGILQKLCQHQHLIIEAGQPNRTLVNNPPFDGSKKGLKYLKPYLQQHRPDRLIIMLGTNDLKAKFDLSAKQISQALSELVHRINDFYHQTTTQQPQILLLCPPIIYEVGAYKNIYKGGNAKSQQLTHYYQHCAVQLNCAFFDTNTVVTTCSTEGIHWSVEQHQALAQALYNKIA